MHFTEILPTTKAWSLIVAGCGALGCAKSGELLPAPATPSCVCAPSKQAAVEAAPVRADVPNIPPDPSVKPKPPVDDPPPISAKNSEIIKAKVAYFDCFANKDPDQVCSLRNWQGGGPNGAAWNIDGAPLECKLTLEAPCSGTAGVRLFGYKSLLAKWTLKAAEGTSTTNVEIPSRLWERSAESSPWVYSTLLLSVVGVLVCTEEPATTYPFADAFIAGFTGGE